ncbi:MAG TPA: FAD-dependent oxidoreductase [Solirubrobacteraceae bacterium]|nr:FAD-dependent oxidoreductase [Solirubrobacteraceae bacterium]
MTDEPQSEPADKSKGKSKGESDGGAQKRLRVLIAGGGVAGLEAALALGELAGERVSMTLIEPEPDFVYRPMAVREPFAYGAAQRYPLKEIAQDIGAALMEDSFAWVDPGARLAHTEAGEQIAYDALMLAPGAKLHPRYTHAYTIDDHHLDDILHGLVQDVESGYVHRLAFVVPGRMGWLLPVYELALMMAGRAYDMGVELATTIVTPEDSPLRLFGLGASEAVAKLLKDAGVETITSAYAEVPRWSTVVINPGDRRLEVDRVVALPELFGPAVRGLPVAQHGFIPVDVHGRVREVERVYAAGDATDFPVKHGGVSSQQADAAAQSIAALAGVPIEPEPFHPIVRGILLTGGKPHYLTARITGGHGFSSEITDTPTWSPPVKIAAKYLAPYLDRLDRRGRAGG